jgi:hypothetical protein
MFLLAHIAGVPAEELLPFASSGLGPTIVVLLASGIGAVLSAARLRRYR